VTMGMVENVIATELDEQLRPVAERYRAVCSRGVEEAASMHARLWATDCVEHVVDLCGRGSDVREVVRRAIDCLRGDIVGISSPGDAAATGELVESLLFWTENPAQLCLLRASSLLCELAGRPLGARRGVLVAEAAEWAALAVVLADEPPLATRRDDTIGHAPALGEDRAEASFRAEAFVLERSWQIRRLGLGETADR
jgi:hypothetical protein